MYLSDQHLKQAIESGKLIFDPPPQKIDATSIDLHLGKIDEAKIWDIEAYQRHEQSSGRGGAELRVGRYNLAEFSRRYLTAPPPFSEGANHLVMRRGSEVIVRKGGFLLWPTQETVGTPDADADLICFVEGKSTKARAGILVHLTAPVIHASWSGKIVLEIANLGPFDLILAENDVIAQLTVAKITSPPTKGAADSSATYRQTRVDGTS